MAILIPSAIRIHNQSRYHRLLQVKKRFLLFQTPSLSSSKVVDIEEESPKRKESISRNRIID